MENTNQPPVFGEVEKQAIKSPYMIACEKMKALDISNEAKLQLIDIMGELAQSIILDSIKPLPYEMTYGHCDNVQPKKDEDNGICLTC